MQLQTGEIRIQVFITNEALPFYMGLVERNAEQGE
jgi:hypothetical protein